MKSQDLIVSVAGFSELKHATPYAPSTFSVTTQKVKRSVVVPGVLVKGNHKAPNNWSYSIRRTENPLGLSTRTYFEFWYEGKDLTYRSGYGKLTQAIASPLNLNDPKSTSLELRSRADSDAYQRLIEASRGSIDLSIDLFQARQNARMLAITDRFMEAFKRIPNKRSVTQVARALGGKWLEWVYGWAPLLNEIHDLSHETLRHYINSTVKVKGRRSLSLITTPTVQSSTPNGPISHIERIDSFAKTQYVVELRVLDNDLTRFTSLNPASIAWELIPYSFVVDWFIDVGGYLRGLETATLYQDRFVSGYKTSVYGNTITSSAFRDQAIPGTNGERLTDAFSATSYSVDYNRTVLTQYPFPSAPTLKMDLSSGRLLNTAALLSQFLHH
ncbi:MAG: maturation protein [Leptochloa chinensis fiers-like virus 1]|nr:MAG: maturation protein [Leptochloa chinensis fiers-like virus 1]UUW21213.1 MAG: maturation protein [Leptochloa chinensis fiers-like virus 1]UUW21217.1 MAG: maturation protein [Leptochloa chinensis fiers-like virus 1]UUW21221.1 MAG: maturation protein [Leptochloa chinensis fiers-like virus 1]